MKVDRIGALHNSYLWTVHQVPPILRVRRDSTDVDARLLYCELRQAAAVGQCGSEVH